MERINVAVRARPLSPEDAKTSPWRISGNSIFIPNQSKFDFDSIFKEDCKTVEVYESRTKDIVAAAVRGFNGTVFAYGQTNSGKTHTMRGSNVEPGVIPLAVHDLFDTIQQTMDREFLLRMSYMEIYNEEINDLLAPEHRKLQIHESVERGIFVAGLREEIVTSPKQVLEFMEFGEAHRHIGETNMNVYSSRSHTIFRMIIESRDKSEDEYSESTCDAVRVSVLNLVDLAGSERAAKTGAEGVRLKEGSHINKSLMTLGTVIKKLSEGAESQGGHVPYRDSKLTRILQPALGGNANTAIICNITLAQIHADETKSSLQFASRALRVTNCAHVNEILTDAALLKRQKKEIEELRAKLQGSHSEHLGEEILNLRNTLLQSELERERIALELEEEKKAQAERERKLREQAKKIENLSSMVLCSNRDENRDQRKKEKRRDTWCPGNLSKETLHQEVESALKPVRLGRDMGHLLPFEELVKETMDDSHKKEENCNDSTLINCSIPDPCSLLHVTRRKPPLRKKSLPVEDNELVEGQAECEKSQLNHESQIPSEIPVDYSTKNVSEGNNFTDEISMGNSGRPAETNVRGMEAHLLIKQLQEKISALEMEKSSSLQNIDSVGFEKEETIYVRENDEEYENLEFLTKISSEVHEVLLEVQGSKNIGEVVFSSMDEVFQSFSFLLDLFADLKSFSLEHFMQIKSILSTYEALYSLMKSKIIELEHEKLLLHNQSKELHTRIEEVSLSGQTSAKALSEQSQQHEIEKSELILEIQALQTEIAYLSSSALAKEKESMRKDLEKTKMKLKDTESKLRNAIQEKTKLEGEKACAEKEIKHLHGQKLILERDISKLDLAGGKRRDSILERSSNVFEPKRGKSLAVSVDQEDYRKLEVLAFEMETAIASLEDKLAVANDNKELAISRTESLEMELASISEELRKSNEEIFSLQELVCSLRSSLEESESRNQTSESSINTLVVEKEELALQLTDALLAIEEERAIWSAKEKASIEAIEGKSKLYIAEISSLSNATSEVKKELDSCREECEMLRRQVICPQDGAEMEKTCSTKISQDERTRNGLRVDKDRSETSEAILKSRLEKLSSRHKYTCKELDTLQMDLAASNKERDELSTRLKELDSRSVLAEEFQILHNQLLKMTKERDRLMSQIEGKHNLEAEMELLRGSYNDMLLKSKAEVELKEKLSALEFRMHNCEISNGKERAKLRMRLKGAQGKLDNFRARYHEGINEMDYMNKQFEDATSKLKAQVAAYAVENLNLKKQISTLKGH